jgi:hypothetical protein
MVFEFQMLFKLDVLICHFPRCKEKTGEVTFIGEMYTKFLAALAVSNWFTG